MSPGRLRAQGGRPRWNCSFQTQVGTTCCFWQVHLNWHLKQLLINIKDTVYLQMCIVKLTTAILAHLSLYTSFAGAKLVQVPWQLEVLLPQCTSVIQSWNWEDVHLQPSSHQGTPAVVGQAGQDWQMLQAWGANQASVGCVLESSHKQGFQPIAAFLCGQPCQLSVN